MKKIFNLLLAVVMSIFTLTAASCTVLAASEEPVWFSNFAVYGDTVYVPEGYESFVSGMKQHEGYPDVLKGKEPASGGAVLTDYCFYGGKIYYYLSPEAGEGANARIYSCDMNGENDTLITDDARGLVAICDNVIYYQGYDHVNTTNEWWNDVIYKIDLSDLSSKKILASRPFNWDKYSLTFYYFDGSWIYYMSDDAYYKMDINGENITAVSDTSDEFTNPVYRKTKVYGDKTYYFDGSTLYERDRNGGNAVSLTSVSSADANNAYILEVTEGYVYYCLQFKYIYAAEKPNNSGISVILDGETLSFDQEPAIIDGRTMVPLRSIFEAMGYTVDWNQDTQTASAVKGSDSITVQLNNSVISYTLNGEANTYTCDTAPQAINGRTLVPVRAIAECAGCDVNWNNNTKTVTITSN